MRIEWLPIAVRDRESQLAYIAERNPWAAIDMDDVIEAAVERLVHHSKIGREGRVTGTRELVVFGTPYMIVYKLEIDAVKILRVLHGAQEWPSDLR